MVQREHKPDKRRRRRQQEVIMARDPRVPTGGKATSQVRRTVGKSVAPRSIAIWYRVECLLTIVSGVALLLAIVAPQWLEAVSGLKPDGGSGAVEWGLASVLAMSTTMWFLLARRHRRMLLAAC
jgi:hypothetical protein